MLKVNGGRASLVKWRGVGRRSLRASDMRFDHVSITLIANRESLVRCHPTARLSIWRWQIAPAPVLCAALLNRGVHRHGGCSRLFDTSFLGSDLAPGCLVGYARGCLHCAHLVPRLRHLARFPRKTLSLR